jgi:hypothetical protein
MILASGFVDGFASRLCFKAEMQKSPRMRGANEINVRPVTGPMFAGQRVSLLTSLTRLSQNSVSTDTARCRVFPCGRNPEEIACE